MRRSRLRTALAVVFGASLALNVLLGAWLAMASAERGPPGLRRIEAKIVAGLPEADRAPFRQTLDTERERYAPAFGQLRQARAEAARLATAEPFDKQALRRAMIAMNGQWTIAIDGFTEALVEALATTSPAGRQAFVAGLPKEQD